MLNAFLAVLVFLVSLPFRFLFLVLLQNSWHFYRVERLHRRLCACHDSLAGELDEFQTALSTSYETKVAELRAARVNPLVDRLGTLRIEIDCYEKSLEPYQFAIENGRMLSEHGQALLDVRNDVLAELEEISCALREARKMSDEELVRLYLDGYREELQNVRGRMNEIEKL